MSEVLKKREVGQEVDLIIKECNEKAHGLFCDFEFKEGYENTDDFNKYIHVSRITDGYVPRGELKTLIENEFPEDPKDKKRKMKARIIFVGLKKSNNGEEKKVINFDYKIVPTNKKIIIKNMMVK
jgi:hypothetical protein